MPDIKRTSKGKQQSFFKDEATDKILNSLLVLLSEHWTLRQRVMTLEKLLEQNKVIAADDLENIEVDEQSQIEFETMRKKLLTDVCNDILLLHYI